MLNRITVVYKAAKPFKQCAKIARGILLTNCALYKYCRGGVRRGTGQLSLIQQFFIFKNVY